MTAKITHVAIKIGDTTHSLPAPNRHHHVIRMIGCIKGKDTQGFLDEDGMFLTRSQAYERAIETGQMSRDTTPGKYNGNLLFSEYLW